MVKQFLQLLDTQSAFVLISKICQFLQKSKWDLYSNIDVSFLELPSTFLPSPPLDMLISESSLIPLWDSRYVAGTQPCSSEVLTNHQPIKKKAKNINQHTLRKTFLQVYPNDPEIIFFHFLLEQYTEQYSVINTTQKLRNNLTEDNVGIHRDNYVEGTSFLGNDILFRNIESLLWNKLGLWFICLCIYVGWQQLPTVSDRTLFQPSLEMLRSEPGTFCMPRLFYNLTTSSLYYCFIILNLTVCKKQRSWKKHELPM